MTTLEQIIELHAELAQSRARIAALEAELHKLAERLGLDEYTPEAVADAAMAMIREVCDLRDTAYQRIAALEAANTRMWEDYVTKRERVAELEAERDQLARDFETQALAIAALTHRLVDAQRNRLPSTVTITCPKCGFQSKSDFAKWEEQP